jgi:hypothetical protein
VLGQADLSALSGDSHVLEQVLQQVLGRKVWVVASIDSTTVTFE